MLDPKNNRIDYGEQLIPPDGYELVQAVGTTYSIDLEILMVLPVALFYSQKLDGNIEQIRFDILDAITKAAEKIKVFYHKGQLKVPRKYYTLMAYWENGIEAITMPDAFSSFHPKVWVIRYEAKELPTIYRLIVTSRNLTLARDWDIAFSTEGFLTDEEQIVNRPIVDFLQFLNSSGKQKMEGSFISDLMKVKFEVPTSFTNDDFIAIGINSADSSTKYCFDLNAFADSWDEMLIISPFIDQKTLEKIHKSSARVFLLSRKEEMDKIPEETLQNIECWQFSEFIQVAEYLQELSEEEVIPLEQNLHAKIYIGMKDKIPYWFLGSANCSDAAQNRNIEFMVQMTGTNTPGLKARDILNLLTGKAKKDNPILFTPYDFKARNDTGPQVNYDQLVRKIKYDISILQIKGQVEQISGGKAFDMLIEIDAGKFSLPDGFLVKLRPLSERQKEPIVLKAGSYNFIKEFTGYPETELSTFIEFRIFIKNEHLSSFLLPMEIKLPKTRLNKILSSIIDSRDKFLRLLTFLLTGEEIEIIGKELIKRPPVFIDKNYLRWMISGTPVFEKLLVAASRYPNKLKSINKLIKCLKEESAGAESPVITAEFENFWQIFQTFIKTNERN